MVLKGDLSMREYSYKVKKEQDGERGLLIPVHASIQGDVSTKDGVHSIVTSLSSTETKVT